MTDTVTDIAAFELPYRRKAMLRRVDFDSGLSMVRLVLREGTRITQVDLDVDSATVLGEALVAAAKDV
mgnify:CR=1 FL=1